MDHHYFVALLFLLLSASHAEDSRMLSTSSHLRVVEGTDVLLPCNALHTADTDVRMWTQLPSRVLFSGSISVSSDPKISLVDSSSLHIVNMTQEYAGEYLCSFFRKPRLRVVHAVLVLVPPSIVADPEHGKVIEQRGSAVRMECLAKGVPKPSITWTYEQNGTQVRSLPSGVEQAGETELRVESVDSHQSGHYRCTADNEVGKPATFDFNLTVLYVPEVAVKPDWIHGDVEATVEIWCTCRSTPLSHLVWVKGGEELRDGHRIRITEITTPPAISESRLKIQRMRRDDLGAYTCLARNAVGEARKTVEVSGLAEPIEIRGTSSGGDSFLLLWSAKSYSPIIEYQLKIRKYQEEGWTDVMIPVMEEGNSIFYSQSYNVTGLDPEQRYEVVLHAHNDFGWNRPSQSLHFFGSGEEIIGRNTQPPPQKKELDVTNPAYLSGGTSVAGLTWLILTTTALPSACWRMNSYRSRT